MKVRMKQSRSERNSIVNPRLNDDMLHNFTLKSKNDIPMISPDSYSKLRAIMIPPSQLRATRNNIFDNQSLNNSRTMMSFEKPQRPPSQFFISPRITGPAPRKLNSIEFPEEVRAHSQYRSRKRGSQSQANIIIEPRSAKSNVDLSRFMFNVKQNKSPENATPSSSSSSFFDYTKPFFRSNKTPNRHDFTRPSTNAQTNFPGTPSTFDYNNSSFRKDLGTPGVNKNDQFDGFGGFKKRPILKGGAFKTVESRISSISEVKEVKEEISPLPQLTQKNFWVKDRFVVNNDVPTKNKMRVKEIEQRNLRSRKLTENERVILQNKENIMVCLDDESRFEQVKYCFVSREIEKPVDFNMRHGNRVEVEFNIKLTEIRKKLGISLQYRFMYLLNGNAIFDFENIPVQENVVIISKKKDIDSIEGIMDHELIRDFYEYGSKNNIKIYTRSHIKSRMNSIIENGQEMDKKYNEILNMFEQGCGKQFGSEELARLVVASKNSSMQTSNNNNFMHVLKAFQEEEHTDVLNEIKESPEGYEAATPLAVQNLMRSNTRSPTLNGSLLSASKSQIDKILTNGPSTEETIKNDYEREIEAYVQDKKLLTGGGKLQAYKEIIKHYKNLSRIKLGFEEPEEEWNTNGITEEDEETKHPEKISDIGDQLGVLLKRFQRPKKKIDYLDIKKELENLQADKSYRSMKSQLAENMQIDKLDENKFERTIEKSKDENANIIERNIKALNTKKSDIDKLFRIHKELSSQNIPKQLNEKKFTRRELHFVYTLYKALCEVTSQRYKEYNPEDGIDYHSFRNGIYQIFLQSEELAEKIFYTIDFNFSGFLNWDEFLDAMQIIRAKTMREKIDLFIKIADTDQNGYLSKEEIFSLAKICLGKFIKTDQDGFLDDLCEYYTKLIFNAIGIDPTQEIPLQAIKQHILSRTEESQLLAMFCGADI